MCHRLLSAVVIAAALPAFSAVADETHEYRQHGAHEHGVATLNLALEGNEIHVELESPAANIVGFEHAPATEAEQEALEQAIGVLKEGAGLLRFSGDAACRLADARVDTPLLEKDGSDEHENHDKAHADIVVEYRFLCGRPGKIEEMEVALFKAFPALAHLDVSFVSEQGQGAVELTASEPVLRF